MMFSFRSIIGATLCGSLLLSQAAPAVAATVARGAQRVPMLTLTLKADCDAPAVVRAIAVHREGLGSHADIARVYLVDWQGVRLTRAASLSSKNGIATLRFTPALQLQACESHTLALLMDLSPDAEASAQHSFTVAQNDVIADGRVQLTTALVSTTITTAPVRRGTINVEFLPLNATIRYGADRTVARLRLTADSVENQEISSIRFTNDGSARGEDLQNIVVKATGRVISKTAASFDAAGDTITLRFDPPLMLERNQTKLLEVHADVRASRRRTIRLIIDEPSDIVSQPMVRTRRG